MAAKLRTWKSSDGSRGAAIWCSPCGHAHSVPLAGPNPWEWNGDREHPTLTPSLLVTRPGDDSYRCHSVVTDGNIFYCKDSLHALAGQTVPLADFPTSYGGSWDDEHGEEMRFEIRESIVYFHDWQPGQHATLFHNGKKLLFRDDLSRFNDAAPAYSWAFEFAAPPREGDHLAFATADREVFGKVFVGEETVVALAVGDIEHRVVRLGLLGDKPHALETVK